MNSVRGVKIDYTYIDHKCISNYDFSNMIKVLNEIGEIMKTYEELMTEYWCRVVPMVDEYNKKHGTNIKPWDCVRYGLNEFHDHPDFKWEDKYAYKFSVAIIEGKPVFHNDRVYAKDTGTEFDWSDPNYMVQLINYSWVWTLTPPKPKRTFMLNGVEFISPFAPCRNHKDTMHYFDVGDLRVAFKDKADRDRLHDYIVDLLLAARDKE